VNIMNIKRLKKKYLLEGVSNIQIVARIIEDLFDPDTGSLMELIGKCHEYFAFRNEELFKNLGISSDGISLCFKPDMAFILPFYMAYLHFQDTEDNLWCFDTEDNSLKHPLLGRRKIDGVFFRSVA